MAIGRRIPITFKTMSETQLEGGTSEESFTPTYNTWAVVNMRSSSRGDASDQIMMRDMYVFSEIRQTEEFTPDKTMLILYNGLTLVIESIKLDTSRAPYYYTITASNNA